MATIDTIEDLIHLLDENPQWAEALRNRVLTRELLELPARFAEYAKANDERMAAQEVRMAAVEARLDRLEQTLASFMEATERRFEAVDKRFEAMDKRFEAIHELLETINARLIALDTRMGRFEHDMGIFRSRHASEIVRGQSILVALEFGYTKTRVLSMEELITMVDRADTQGIAAGDLQSFRRADLIMEAVHNQTGERGFIAVEISYTVNGRDTSRAMRNAQFLRRFTGQDSLAVVSGVRMDNLVEVDISAGSVKWYGLDDQDLGTG